MRSISVTQLGVTLVRTLVTGVHAGTTLKYVRGTVHAGLGESPSGLLDLGESLDTGEAEGRFDLDMGVLAVAGPLRFGALMRNVREPEFTNAAPMGLSVPPVRLPRQVRAGVAFDAEATPTGLPLTVAFDGDLRSYETPSGPRQVVALGAEGWFLTERLGVRAGGRLNTKGGRERAATLGLSVAMRGGLFLDGHVVGGGSKSEEGWGLAARVSF